MKRMWVRQEAAWPLCIVLQTADKEHQMKTIPQQAARGGCHFHEHINPGPSNSNVIPSQAPPATIH